MWWWPFRRRRPAPGAGVEPAGPGAHPERAAPVAGRRPAEEDEHRAGSAAPAFSGAEPDAAAYGDRRAASSPQADDRLLGGGELERAGAEVLRLVRAVRGGAALPAAAGDPAPAARAATAALAGRMPGLSGADDLGDGTPETTRDLLHAYADLLAARAGTRRPGSAPDVGQDSLVQVAHLAAGAAAVLADDPPDDDEDAERRPPPLTSAGLPASLQLRAAALLLAQTCDDGGGEVDALADEARALLSP